MASVGLRFLGPEPASIFCGVASHAQSVLKQLIRDGFPTMAAFAEQCGVSQSLVWRDCHGRKISDQRFVFYLRALNADDQERLLRARLMDLLPRDFNSWVQVGPPARIEETPGDSSSGLALLSPKTRTALNRLAQEMAHDPALHDWILQLIHRICPGPARDQSCDVKPLEKTHGRRPAS